MGELSNRDILLIPNLPGVFVSMEPRGDLESLAASWRLERGGADTVVVHFPEGERKFRFYPGDHYHPVERAYFLQVLFRFPLEAGVLTSGYGMRKDPFGGHLSFHNGIDIGAPEGTNVVAARGGRVHRLGYDEIYGRHVVITHEGGNQTMYGHLSQISVDLYQSVDSGTIIGKVGSTGRATGPHLHFEIRNEGGSRDPIPLLPSRESNDR